MTKPDFDMPVQEDEVYLNARGRRKQAKAEGLKGKEKRDRLKELREEDKGKTKSEKKEAAKERKENYREAVVEGTAAKGFFGKIANAVKKVGASPIRGAFLALVKLNVFGLASRLSALEANKGKNEKLKTAYNRITALWIQFGGKKSALYAEANRSKNKKAIAGKLAKDKLSANGVGMFNSTGDLSPDVIWYGVTGVEEAAAATATATPIIVPVLATIKSVSETVGDIVGDPSDAPIIDDYASKLNEELPADEAKKIVDANKPQGGGVKTDNSATVRNVAIFAGIGLLALIILRKI